MNNMTDLSSATTLAYLSNDRSYTVDFVEAGAGAPVVLVHSSMAGARQWTPLMRDLEDHARVRAVNLFGYGATQPWSGEKPPSLDDFAKLVALTVPETAENVSLVGHSFGAAVAMQAAAHQLQGRVKSLVLIEPSLFYLLNLCGHREAFDEVSALADYTIGCISNGNPEAAAEGFIDYWGGPGTWGASSPRRQSAFVQSIPMLAHEWDAVLRGNMKPSEWTAALPRHTMLISSANTARPSRELVELLLQARPEWAFASVWEGGHMAPLTHPRFVNPIIRGFLAGWAAAN